MVKDDKPLITSSSSPVTWCGNHYQKQEETSPLKPKEIAPPPFYPFQYLKPASPQMQVYPIYYY